MSTCAMEGYERRFDGLDGRRSLRSTDRCNAQQVRNIVPYKAVFAPDPGTANYSDNFIMSDEPGVDGTTVDHAASGCRGILRKQPQRWGRSTSIQIMARATEHAGS